MENIPLFGSQEWLYSTYSPLDSLDEVFFNLDDQATTENVNISYDVSSDASQLPGDSVPFLDDPYSQNTPTLATTATKIGGSFSTALNGQSLTAPGVNKRDFAVFDSNAEATARRETKKRKVVGVATQTLSPIEKSLTRKKRNRLSAQKSRARKKALELQLKEENKRLREALKSQPLQAENKQLKAKLERKNERIHQLGEMHHNMKISLEELNQVSSESNANISFLKDRVKSVELENQQLQKMLEDKIKSLNYLSAENMQFSANKFMLDNEKRQLQQALASKNLVIQNLIQQKQQFIQPIYAQIPQGKMPSFSGTTITLNPRLSDPNAGTITDSYLPGWVHPQQQGLTKR